MREIKPVVILQDISKDLLQQSHLELMFGRLNEKLTAKRTKPKVGYNIRVGNPWLLPLPKFTGQQGNHLYLLIYQTFVRQ